MEYYIYLINNKFGQQIKITNNRQLFPNEVYDFVLFENGILFLLGNNRIESWNNVWHIKDKHCIEKVKVWYEELLKNCTDFKSMLKRNALLIEEMKKINII